MFSLKVRKYFLHTVNVIFWLFFLDPANASLTSNKPAALQTQSNIALPTIPLPMSSTQLGINGPWQVGLEKSSQFGWIVNNKYLHAFDHDQRAVGLELDIGSLENREAMTVGLLLSKNQKVKITAERLEQRMPIYWTNYNDNLSIPQYAGGAAYQYIASDHALIRSIEMGGYYSAAQTKNYLSQNSTSISNIYLDTTHLLGGQASGFHLSANVYPWSHAIFTTTLNYDDVYFPVQSTMTLLYPNALPSQIGYTVEFSQLFHENHLQLQCTASQRATYDEYKGSVGWLNQLKGGSIISINATFAHIENFYIPFDDNRIGLQFNWQLETPKNTSAQLSLHANAPDDLSAWTNDPAVRMDNVLAEAARSVRETSEPVLPPAPPIPPVPPSGDSADLTIWADNPFDSAVTFEGKSLSLSYSTQLSNGTFSGLPNWTRTRSETTGDNTRVSLAGLTPHLQKQTLYVFLITATNQVTGNAYTKTIKLTVIPRLVTLEQVINNQLPAVLTRTEDRVLQGEYTEPPPNTLDGSAPTPFKLIGAGAPIEGSYTYIVTGSTSLHGMGCRVDYSLNLFGYLNETATPIASDQGQLPVCSLTLRRGMNAAATLNISEGQYS